MSNQILPFYQIVLFMVISIWWDTVERLCKTFYVVSI